MSDTSKIAERLRRLADVIEGSQGDDDETVVAWIAELREVALDAEHVQRELDYLTQP